MTDKKAVPTRTPVTGCANHYPMVDRNGKQIHVGDKIRYQHCTGRYGQTAISETVVTDAHYPYGMIAYANFHLDFNALVLRGVHEYDDWEHGHKTWVEIIPQEGAS